MRGGTELVLVVNRLEPLLVSGPMSARSTGPGKLVWLKNTVTGTPLVVKRRLANSRMLVAIVAHWGTSTTKVCIPPGGKVLRYGTQCDNDMTGGGLLGCKWKVSCQSISSARSLVAPARSSQISRRQSPKASWPLSWERGSSG